MNDNIQTLLVPVDFSDVTEKVLQTTLMLAQAFQSRVVLLHVAEPDPDFVGLRAGAGQCEEFGGEGVSTRSIPIWSNRSKKAGSRGGSQRGGAPDPGANHREDFAGKRPAEMRAMIVLGFRMATGLSMGSSREALPPGC